MQNRRFHGPSLLAGAGLALLAFVSLGQAAGSAPATFEYKIVDDVEAKELDQLSTEGWEFVGYLGQGKKGNGNDQTLWRRAGH